MQHVNYRVIFNPKRLLYNYYMLTIPKIIIIIKHIFAEEVFRKTYIREVISGWLLGIVWGWGDSR